MVRCRVPSIREDLRGALLLSSANTSRLPGDRVGKEHSPASSEAPADNESLNDSYEPIVTSSSYPTPEASIRPDKNLGWIARLHPILLLFKTRIIISLTASLVGMAALVSIPKVLGDAIDAVEQDQDVAPYAIGLLVLGLLRGIGSYIGRGGLQKVGFRMEFHLRTMLYNHFLHQPYAFYDTVQSGQLISRANSDIRSIQMFLSFAPIMTLQIFTFVSAIILMLIIDWQLTLISLAPLPAVYYFGVRLRNKIFPVSWIAQERLADIATLVEENISGARVIRTFTAEKHQIKELLKNAERLKWINVFIGDTRARLNPLIEALPRFGTVAVLYVGGEKVIDGQLQVGTIVTFSAYVVLLAMPFRFLGFLLMMGQRAKASANRIFEVFDTKPSLTDSIDSVRLDNPVETIEIENINFAYNNADLILKDLSLRVKAGETIALVGSTGSGKSTLSRLLPRYYDPQSGKITFDGIDIKNFTLSSLRAHVGVVFEEPFLFAASIRDNISFGHPDAPISDVENAAKAAYAHTFITNLPKGYDTVIGERGYDLSGGQRQRLALARGLLINPHILILDDATSAVDVQTEKKIHEALQQRSTKSTTILIAHRLSTIALADRVILLDKGRIISDGTHSDLLATDPRYAEILNQISKPEKVLPSDGTNL